MDLQLTKSVRIGVAASCLIIAGCGGGSELMGAETAAETSVAEGPSVSSVVLDMHESIADCMKERGWEHEVVTGQEEAVPISDRGGFVSEHGYGIANRPEPGKYERTPNPNAVYTNSLSDEERAAYMTDLFGQPKPQLDVEVFTGDSCGAVAEQAASELLGGISVRDATAKAARLAAADPEVAAANAAWSECMKGKGYTYELPHEPAQEIAALFRQIAGQEKKGPDSPEGKELKQRELDVAVDDFACYQEAGLREARKGASVRANRSIYEQLATPASQATE